MSDIVIYDLDAFFIELERVRGRRVPPATFYRWLSQASPPVPPKGPGGLYTQEEVDRVLEVVSFCRRLRR